MFCKKHGPRVIGKVKTSGVVLFYTKLRYGGSLVALQIAEAAVPGSKPVTTKKLYGTDTLPHNTKYCNSLEFTYPFFKKIFT